MDFRSGFVAIVGYPNAGKSTLLNALVGEKLAIVSPKAQSTRNRILGIVQVKPQESGKKKLTGQIVLIDTPGVHRPSSSLGKKMMSEVEQSLEGCDLVIALVDVSRRMDERDDQLFRLLAKAGLKTFLVLNKIDLLPDKSKLLPMIEKYSSRSSFAEVLPISAARRQGLESLLDRVLHTLPKGPHYFPEDQLTDQPLRFMAAEIIRERILRETKNEVPHAITVLIDRFEDHGKTTYIAATIYCEREGQKRILVGTAGQMLKKIGSGARPAIEKLVGKKIYLELFVKIKANWRDNRSFVEEMDWRKQLEALASGRPEGE